MTHSTSLRAKGFTLVEVIVYIAVLGILGGSFTNALLWGMGTYAKTHAMQETTWNAQMAMNVMMQEIREAEQIYAPTTSASQLSLVTSKYAPGGHAESFLDFFLCQERLCLKKESQDPIVLTPDNVRVASLSFLQVKSSPTAESVRIILRIEYNNPNNRPELASALELSSVASVR